MNDPVACCLICGYEKELGVWADPNLTNGRYFGVCKDCRDGRTARPDGALENASPIEWLCVQEYQGGGFIRGGFAPENGEDVVCLEFGPRPAREDEHVRIFMRPDEAASVVWAMGGCLYSFLMAQWIASKQQKEGAQ